MKNWLLGTLYFFVVLSILGGVALGGAMLWSSYPYGYEDQSRAAICKRSAGTAPECAMLPESAEKVLDALLACDNDFFEVLKEERAAFGRVPEIVHINRYGYRRTHVAFAKPIEAYGLRLTAYTQVAVDSDHGWAPTQYAWGFQVIALPKDVAKAIELRRPQIEKFREYYGGWLQESAFGAPVSFMIHARPDELFPGTYLECNAGEEASAKMGKLPRVSKLFQVYGM
ncbi:hypothetical protein ILFOPFJJ_04918 [Ensifer psoraleae]|uniref:hypothetical protein n=1 Tax=Sinorhizobium psoraleae TaxID=520838 RepID=UPI00156879E4|nr:hypothetical protein [Sinorhizobium psoraleae]NRP73997.1 hypothetical protein [Sinorhizobium psoraleae]